MNDIRKIVKEHPEDAHIYQEMLERYEREMQQEDNLLKDKSLE